MIPRTYPTTYVTANGKQQMVVFFLSSVSGLQRFKDYIPVSFPQYGDQKDNSYDNSGVVLVDVLSSSSGLMAWKDYIPVFVESNAADAWRVSINGYIPVGLATAPTLALDFTSSSETLDPRITFSRTSNATVTDSSGTLRYAPHNLLTFSEQFDNAAWSKTSGTVTANAGVAPDGTTTADQIASTGAGVFRSSITVTQGLLHTASVYAKYVSGGTSFLFGFDSGPTSGRTTFNLQTGTIVSNDANVASSSIINMGNGWYRCVVSVVTTSTSCILVYYNATSGSNWLVWGAQLNVSNMVGGVTSSLSTYYPTTVKNLVGFSEDFANAAWTKSNSFIQTNLLTWSEQFDNAAWGNSDTTDTANTSVAPNGTTTADTITASATTALHAIFQTSTSTTGTTRTFSVYVKAGTHNFVQLFFNGDTNVFANFNLATGVVGSVGSASTSSIIAVGNGWYRCIINTSSATATAVVQIALITSATSARAESWAAAGTETILVWGAQLVQGSTAGDYQQSFSAAAPVMYRAPNGTLTADKLVETTATGQHRIFLGTSPTTNASTTHTVSFYAKAAERTRVYVGMVEGNTFSRQGSASFNLSNGTVLASNTGLNGATGGSASIIPVGDGWYRCAYTLTLGGTDTRIFSDINLISSGTTISYTGDGTSGIYIWGAQLSDSASLDTYVNNPLAAPSSTAYYAPRFDYDPTTLAPRGLLIEEQRTNSIRNNTMQGAVAGTPGTLPTNWSTSISTTTGLTTSVIGSGSENGVSYIDIRLSGTASGAGAWVVQFEANSIVTASSGQTWTGSVYWKLQSGSLSGLSGGSLRIDERAGGFLTTQTLVSGTPTSSGLQTQRISGAATLANASTTNIVPYVRFTIANGAAIDITLRIGMPQLEQGAFATSVIPTTTAAATRNADAASITGSNFSGFYNQNEGTVYADVVAGPIATGGFPRAVELTDGTASSNFMRVQRYSTGMVRFSVTASSSNQAAFDSSTVALGNTAKAALAYKINDIAGTANAASPGTDTSANIPVVDRMLIGDTFAAGSSLNSTIKKLAYYPKRLTNAEIQSITA